MPLDCSWHMAGLRMKFQLRQAVVASHRAAHAELSVVAEGEPSGVPGRLWSVSICSGMFSRSDALAEWFPLLLSASVNAIAGRADATISPAASAEYANRVAFNPGAIHGDTFSISALHLAIKVPYFSNSWHKNEKVTALTARSKVSNSLGWSGRPGAIL